MSTRDVGALGEKQAVRYLKKLGYKILETNLVTRFGEIDVVAADKGCLVFVEVKLRRTKEFGAPSEAVDKRKQEKILRSSIEYVKSRGLVGKDLRFDVLCIGPEPGKIELVTDAFSSGGRYTL